MALKIVRAKVLPIGVDLGTSAIKMAQIRVAEGGMELIAAGLAEIPPVCQADVGRRMGFLPKGIRDILRSGMFRGTQCVLSLPAEETFVHHVRIPRLSPTEAVAAVHRELEGKLPYPVAKAVVRHVVVGNVYGEDTMMQEVIAVSAPRATVDAYLGAARKAKLNVIGINIEPCAIVECFSHLFRRASDADRTVLFVDIGTASTQAVLARGSQIVFARNLTAGGRELDNAVAAALEMQVDQAKALRRQVQAGTAETDVADELYRHLRSAVDGLADELIQCIRYYDSVFRTQPIDRVIFVGGQAFDKRLCQTIAQRINLPAQIGDPLLRVKSASEVVKASGLDRRQAQPHWAVAIGLSLGTTKAA